MKKPAGGANENALIPAMKPEPGHCCFLNQGIAAFDYALLLSSTNLLMVRILPGACTLVTQIPLREL